MSRGKEGLIQSFLDAIKEVAVDCVLNKVIIHLSMTTNAFSLKNKHYLINKLVLLIVKILEMILRWTMVVTALTHKPYVLKVVKINAVKQLDENGTKVFIPPKVLV